ncbi:aspartate--tRNA ligase [Chloroflexota bacterium]
MLKTKTCGELRKEQIGTQVVLAGWVNRRRDHGSLIFIDLRDRDGLVQVVFNPELSADSHQRADELRNEFVIMVKGEVARRPAGTENPKLPTGEVEVIVGELEILNRSKTPPFNINEDAEVDENVRLKYRYLDLRREKMRENLILRHRVTKFMREFLDARGFMEVETPVLIKSTPEGARDYLVPSRVHPGKFYALPQSPQQLKQLLMVAGVEKYYQIARCFRDEDTRADRQPEFTQLDLEMSFVEEEDILNLMEELFISMVEEVKPGLKMAKPFPRLSYAETMEKYGTDKPDLRFGMEIRDLSDIVAQSDFGVFTSAIAAGGKVKGICAPGCSVYTRNQLNELNDYVRSLGAGGVVTISLGAEAGSIDKLAMEDIKSVAAKFLAIDQIKQIAQRLNAAPGDLLLIVAGEDNLVSTVLGELRREIGKRLGLADPNALAFAFIVDFPLLAWDKKANRWSAMHHPFTAPKDEDMALLEKDPGRVRAQSYDFVCNGSEVSSGSIRIHRSDLQRKVLRLLGHKDDEIEALFGHMLEAFDYGAPPHGGIAPGIDRVVMLLAGEENIREVVAFPKNQGAVDLTFGAPAPVTKEQLQELHIEVREDGEIG